MPIPAGPGPTSAPGLPESSPVAEPLARVPTQPEDTAGPDLSQLYVTVGQAIEALRLRDPAAAAELRAIYRTIPLADALRVPALRREAVDKLQRIQKRLPTPSP